MYIIKIFFMSIISLTPLHGMEVDEVVLVKLSIFTEYKKHQSQNRLIISHYYPQKLISSQKQEKNIEKMLRFSFNNINTSLNKIKEEMNNEIQFKNFIKDLNNIAISNFEAYNHES